MPRAGADGQASLRLLVRILRRRWKLMLAVFLVLALPITAWNLFFEKKTYEAAATLFVDSAPEEYSFMKDWIPGSDIPLQMAVLKSRSLAEVVVDSLPRESIEELLKEAMYRDYVLELANSIRRLLGRELVVYSPKERAVVELQNARATFNVKGPASASLGAKGSQVEIKTVATRPKVAMDLANTYVEILLNRSRSYVREEARAAREFLETQLGQAQETLREHEEKLTRARRAAGGLHLSQRTELELTRLAQAEAAVAEAQLQKKFVQARLGSLRAQMEGGERAREAAGAPPDGASSPGRRLRERVTQLEERLAGLLERYTEQHPMVIATRSELRELRQKAEALPPEAPRLVRAPASELTLPRQVADLDLEMASIRAKEEMLEQRVAAIRRGLGGSGVEELEQARLLRTVEGGRNFTALLMDKLTAARIREQGDVKSLRVIDQATLPMVPSGARAAKQVGMGLLFSLAASLGLGALLEVFRDPVETEQDVSHATGLPLLAMLPALDLGKLSDGRPRSAISLWAEPTPPIVFAERCRSLAMLLDAMAEERPLRSLLIASAAPEEGKSTVLVNLAWACAELGKRVLLVDTDLRRPSLSRILQLPDGPGLTEMLSAGDDGDDLFVALGPGAHVLRSGAAHPAPQTLLTPAPVERLLARLQARADLVLFDSAPLVAISDNLHLAARTDAVLLVARAGVTGKGELARAHTELERFGARTLGVVLNGLPPHAVRRSYGKYYAYYAGEPPRSRGWKRWRPWARTAGPETPVRRNVTRTVEREGDGA